MFRAFNLSSKYGRSKAEKILLTYQTFAISVKVPTPYTTQPPCHNCVAILGGIGYNINVMRQSACLVVNTITVNNFASLLTVRRLAVHQHNDGPNRKLV